MDWKIIAALIVAVAIVVSGFLSSGGFNLAAPPAPSGTAAQNPSGSNPLGPIGDFFSGAADVVSNVFSGTPAGKNVNRTLQVSGELSVESNAIILNTPANSVDVEFGAPVSMNVGSEKINFSDGKKISIGNFAGKLGIYANRTVILDGSAEIITVSGIGIIPHSQKAAQIKATASAKSIKAYNASAGSLAFNATGSMNIGNGKVILKPENELLMIENFMGNLDMSGASLALDGFSTKVMLNGKEKVSVG